MGSGTCLIMNLNCCIVLQEDVTSSLQIHCTKYGRGTFVSVRLESQLKYFIPDNFIYDYFKSK